MKNNWYQAQVIAGKGRGKILGFPTLNLTIPENLLERHGIYAGLISFNNHNYQGAFHFGPIPVFDQPDPTLEVFVLDEEVIVPPKKVAFSLVKRLRSIERFDSPKELVNQIKRDVRDAKNILGS